MEAPLRYLAIAITIGVAPLLAQEELTEEVLATGQGLQAVIAEKDGLLVQGPRLVSFIELKKEARVQAEISLGKDAFIWTRLPDQEFFSIATQGAGSRSTLQARALDTAPIEKTEKDPQSLFRGEPSSAAQFRKFLHQEEGKLVSVSPRLRGLEVEVSGAANWKRDLPARVESEQSLGWGLGYEMSARLVAPYFAFAECNGEAGMELLYRDRDRFMICSLNDAKSQPQAWGSAPTNEKFKVVRFDQRVPPLIDDFDRDGRSDLIHVDPGGGYVFVYRGKNRDQGESRDPDQVFNVGGHVLWRFLEDVNGDGRKDLIALTMSRLNILAQVSVMRQRSLPVRLLCRLQKENGDFELSAAWSLSLDLPCEIALTRNMRRIRYRAPVVVLGSNKGKARVLGIRDGRALILERNGEDWEEVAVLPNLVLDNGHWAEPFDAIRQDFDGDGNEELIMLARDVDGSLDRLIRIRLP